MISLQPCEDREEWDEFVLEHEGHPLQLWGWGETKAAHGWYAERVIARDLEKDIIGGAQVLVRKLPWPLNAVAYVPRGPVVEKDDAAEFLEALASYAKSQFRAVVLTMEPDWAELPEHIGDNWRPAPNSILIPETLILDLGQTEDELLAPMSKKTRQYIRKSSGEKGLAITQVKDREELADVMDIYRQTAERAGFPLHEDAYYYDLFDLMGEATPVFVAKKDGRVVAFLWLAISQFTAFELYGGMNDDGQQLRANYALKWHAIRKMRDWGIERYDMNGLVSDGVSNFKRGFANHEDKLVGTYDRPLSPLYIVWTKAFPIAKKLIRAVKRR